MSASYKINKNILPIKSDQEGKIWFYYYSMLFVVPMLGSITRIGYQLSHEYKNPDHNQIRTFTNIRFID